MKRICTLAIIATTSIASQTYAHSRAFVSMGVTIEQHLTAAGRETREVQRFEGIRLEGIADVYLTQDPNQLVQVEAEDGIGTLVTTQVVNGVLVIRTDESLHSRKPIKVYVSAPNFNKIDIQGVGNVTGLTSIVSPALILTTAGVGNMQLKVMTKRVEVTLQGTGTVNLTGTTQTSIVDCAGTGDFHGKTLAADDVNVTSTGTGNVDVSATKSLTVKLTGVGNVLYTGDVKSVTSTISGLGSIRRLGTKSY